jgi:hypothetical protein
MNRTSQRGESRKEEKVMKNQVRFLVIFVLTVVFVGTTVMNAQTTLSMLKDASFQCVSADPKPQRVDVDLSHFPFDQVSIRMVATDDSTDKIKPVISKVLGPTGSSVLTNSGKITSQSMMFTVSATDNIGIQSYFLQVDGRDVIPGAGGDSNLPPTFKLVWNANVQSVGTHSFSLKVCDAAGNCSEPAVWRMVK